MTRTISVIAVPSPGATTDYTSALQAYVDLSSANEIYLPDGDYRLTTVNITRPLKVTCGANVRFIKLTDEPVLKFTDGFDWDVSVSAVTETLVTLQDNTVDTGTEGSTQSYGEVLTLGTAQIVTKGDRFKIYSDDVCDGARPGTTSRSRKGEDCHAGLASTGTSLTLTAALRDTYSTVVRIAKYKDSGRFELEGGTFDYDDTIAGSDDWTTPYVEFIACEPKITKSFSPRALWPAFRFIGCFDFIATDIKGMNGRNDGTNGQFGYLLDVRNSDGGRATRLHGINLRHVITSNPEEVATGNTEAWRHGKSWNVVCTDGEAYGMSNAAWDTHEDADGWTFIGCKAVASYIGGRSNGTGYTARGRRTSFIGCKAHGTRIGFWLTNYADILMDACEAEDATFNAVRLEQNGNGGSAYTQRRITIRNCRLGKRNATNLTGYRVGVIEAVGADATNNIEFSLENTVLLLNGIAATTKAIDLTYAKMRISNVTVDVSGFSAATGLSIINLTNTSGCDVTGRGLRVIAGAYNTVGSLISCNSTSTHTGFIDDVEYEGDNAITSAVAGNIYNIFNNPLIRVSGVRSIAGSIATTRFIAQTSSASAIPRFANVNDPIIMVEMTGTNGAVAGGNWPDNVRPGTNVTLLNNSNGTITYTEPNVAVAAGAVITRVRSESAVSANKWKVAS